jgi:hypothetical protein
LEVTKMKTIVIAAMMFAATVVTAQANTRYHESLTTDLIYKCTPSERATVLAGAAVGAVVGAVVTSKLPVIGKLLPVQLGGSLLTSVGVSEVTMIGVCEEESMRWLFEPGWGLGGLLGAGK